MDSSDAFCSSSRLQRSEISGAVVSYAGKTSSTVQEVEMKDIGQAKYLLGIEISQDKTNRVSHLQQHKLIKELLAEQGMANAIPAATSMLSTGGDPAAHVQDDDLVDKTKYLHVIAKLNYLMRGTRPDIAYSTASAN